MDSNTIIGVAASVFTGVSLLPQLIKIIKEKEPSDISYWVFLILISGLILWVIYGAMLGDLIIIISNAISLCINLTVLAFNMYYQRMPAYKRN
ncbi:SemiSWEET family sugar transporter [Niabella ginsengisoli]|uniref:SemiSWEET transporter n=1 Tax=Niabella ginsengisoli TaxID=522298 RepID=A0ABS9SHQ6_9BACT|nr:SemiSWEET transporter [Niabella ginsengisoli]MCH5597887.1 SemiSWEET transporter [Niabella ginsengisoli]